MFYVGFFTIGIICSIVACVIPLRGDSGTGRPDFFDRPEEPRIHTYRQRALYDQDEVDR